MILKHNFLMRIEYCRYITLYNYMILKLLYDSVPYSPGYITLYNYMILKRH